MKTLTNPAWRYTLGATEFKVMRLGERQWRDGAVEHPESAEAWARPLIEASPRYNPDQECLAVGYVSTRKLPIGLEIISNGTMDTILVHPREVFKSAIIIGAAGILLFHNHPSGDPTPSEADIRVTRDLIRAGNLLKIDVVDHLILGSRALHARGYVSLRELGYFYSA